MAINDESILTSIKKVLGIAEDYVIFDEDVKMHINSIFSILQQLGIGPNEGYAIDSKAEKWKDFMPGENKLIMMAKSYVAIRVRLLFDPPDRSYVADSLKEQYLEIGFRLLAAVNPPVTFA